MARGGILGNHEPAARGRGTAFVQVDGGGVIGQVGIVDAVAGDALALRPLAALLSDFAQTARELLGLGQHDGAGLTIAQVDGGGARGCDSLVVCGLGVLEVTLREFDEREELGPLVVRHDGQATAGGAEGLLEDVVAREDGDGLADEGFPKGCARAGAQVGNEGEKARQLGEGDLGRVDDDAADDLGVADSGNGEFADDFLRVGLGEDHAVREAGCLEDAARARDGVTGNVGGKNARRAVARRVDAPERLFAQGEPRGFVVLRPCFEPPVVALEAGRAVGEDLGCLQHDAAASAAGIDQDGEDGGGAVVRGGGRRVARACHGVRAGLLPAKLRQGQRGVVGPQHVGGAGADCLAREALEQRVAGKVEVQAGAVSAQREQDARVGVIHVHVGATAGDLDEAVAQGILHAQGGIMGVAQLIARAARRDGDGCARREDVLPSDGA